MPSEREAVGSPQKAALVPPAVARPIVVHALPPTVNVFVQEKPRSWFDTYAPAIPGVVVAVFGLYVAHKLTQRRDRHKQVVDLVASLKALIQDAGAAAVSAWLSDVGAERFGLVSDAKSKIQAVGIAATNLKRQSARCGRRRWVPGIKAKWNRRALMKRSSIDVSREVAFLRKVCTSDPFEDPSRAADTSKTSSIHSAIGTLTLTVDRLLIDSGI